MKSTAFFIIFWRAIIEANISFWKVRVRLYDLCLKNTWLVCVLLTFLFSYQGELQTFVSVEYRNFFLYFWYFSQLIFLCIYSSLLKVYLWFCHQFLMKLSRFTGKKNKKAWFWDNFFCFQIFEFFGMYLKTDVNINLSKFLWAAINNFKVILLPGHTVMLLHQVYVLTYIYSYIKFWCAKMKAP